MSQLKCEPPNPYLDDYYYTARQEVRHAEDNRDGPQLVRNNIEHEQQGSDYIPKQFKNSLGKLQVRKVSPPRHFYIKKIKIIKVKKNSTFDFQCVTVKTPRQIIDVGMVLLQEGPNIVHEGSPAPGAVVGGTVGEQTGANKHYKQVLLQIEKLCTLLLRTEDDEKMMSAIPTGTPLREQVLHLLISVRLYSSPNYETFLGNFQVLGHIFQVLGQIFKVFKHIFQV